MLELFKLAGVVTVEGLKEVNKDLITLEKSAKRSVAPLVKFGRTAERTGKTLTKNLTLPIVALGGAATKFAADFEKAIVTSTAIMGKQGQEFRKEMEETAKTISKTTTFSADELAKSYYYLASAGYNAEQSMSALGKVAKFAEAGQFDLQIATDLLTDAQSALGLATKDVAENEENLVRVSDVLVKANTLANASVQQFSEALTNRAGAALRAVGKDVEEGVAVLAAFADQGTKGAEAGTQLSIVMRDLQKAYQSNTAEFKRQNVAVYDANGEFRNMADVIGDVENALEGKSDAEKKATLSLLGFQEKSVASLLTLIGTSEKIREYEQALRDAGGTTEDVADKQIKNFNDQLKILLNRLQVAAIEFGNVLLPILKDRVLPVLEGMLKAFEGLAKFFQRLPPQLQSLIVAFAAFAAVIGPLLIAVGQLGLAVQALPALIVAAKIAMVALAAVFSSAGLVVVAIIGFLVALGAVILKVTERQRQANKVRKLGNELAEASGERSKELQKRWEKEAEKLADLNREYERRRQKMVALGKLYKSAEYQSASDKRRAELAKATVERQKEYNDAQTNSYNMLNRTRQAHEKKVKVEEQEKKAIEEKTQALESEEAQIKRMNEQLLDEEERRQIRKQEQEWSEQRAENTQKIIEWEKKLRENREKELAELETYMISSEDYAEKYGEAINDIIQENIDAERLALADRLEMIAGFTNQVGGLFQALYDNEAIRIDNNYKRQQKVIENSEASEKEKKAQLEKLDEDYDKKRSDLQKKQMNAEKAQSVFSILVNGAAAVIRSLAEPGGIAGMILAGIVGAMATAQAAIVASRPIPEMAEGGVIKKRTGGVMVNAAEAGEDEGFIPMKKGTASIADAIIGSMRRYDNNVNQGAAGAATTNAIELHVGTLVADESGLRELERRLKSYRISDENRQGII